MPSKKNSKKTIPSSRVPPQKMQLIYFREADIERTSRLEYEAKTSHEIPGRVGITLIARAGIYLLDDLLKKDPKKFLKVLEHVAYEGLLEEEH